MPTEERDRHSAYATAERLADWNLSAEERADAKQGRRFHRITTARTEALAIVTRDAERRAFDDAYVTEVGEIAPRQSRDGSWHDFTITDTPRNLAEARWIIDATNASVAHAGKRIGSIADPARMTAADVQRIAHRAASVAARMASRVGRKLSREEYEDLQCACVLDVVARGAKSEPIGYGGLPKWRAIEREDIDASAPMDTEALAAQWSALTFNFARREVLARRDRLAAESPDESDDGTRLTDYLAAVDDDLSAASATAADVIGAKLERWDDDAGETVPAPLSGPERAAILAALTPSRAAELAEREHATLEAFYKRVQRGRIALAERWPTRRDAERDFRTIPSVRHDRAARSAIAATPRLMAADVARHSAAVLDWGSSAIVYPALADVPASRMRTDANGAPTQTPIPALARIAAPVTVR